MIPPKKIKSKTRIPGTFRRPRKLKNKHRRPRRQNRHCRFNGVQPINRQQTRRSADCKFPSRFNLPVNVRPRNHSTAQIHQVKALGDITKKFRIFSRLSEFIFLLVILLPVLFFASPLRLKTPPPPAPRNETPRAASFSRSLKQFLSIDP